MLSIHEISFTQVMVISPPSSARILFSGWRASNGFVGNSGGTREQFLPQLSEMDNTYIKDKPGQANGGLI